MVNVHTKCTSLNNEPCIARPTLVDLNLEKLHCYPLMVSLGRFNGSHNTLDDLLSRICIPNKTKDVFSMITRINGSETLTKHVPCDCKCNFNGRKTKWRNKELNI